MLKRLLDYNDGEEMDIVVLIKNSQLRRNKKNKLFLAMQFGDGSGEIRATFGMQPIKMRLPLVQVRL